MTARPSNKHFCWPWRAASTISVVALLAMSACNNDHPPAATPSPSQPDAQPPVPEPAPLELTGQQGTGEYDFTPTNVVHAIKNKLPQARLFGLGEMAHRNIEYGSLREALLVDMIENHKLRLVMFEEYWGDLDRINSHLTTCDEASIRATFAAHTYNFRWQTNLGLVRFICEWNLAHPADTVTLTGVDPRTPYRDTHALHDFFAAQAATANQAWLADLFQCTSKQAKDLPEFIDTYQDQTTQGHVACMGAIAKAELALASLDAASPPQIRRLKRHIAGLRGAELEQAYNALAVPGSTAETAGPSTLLSRATYMSELILLFVEDLEPDEMAAYIAHNAHVIKDSPNAVSHPNPTPLVGYKNVGLRLTEALGEGYASIVMNANTYQYRSNGTTVTSNPVAGSIESALVERPGIRLPLLVLADQASEGDGVFATDQAIITGYFNLHPASQADLFVYLEASTYDTRLQVPAPPPPQP